LYRTFREPQPLGPLLRLGDLGVLAWIAPGIELDQPLVRGVRGALEWWEQREAAIRPPVGAEARARPSVTYLGALLAPFGAKSALEVAENRLRLTPPDLRILEAEVAAAAAPEALLDPGRPPSAVTRALRPLPPEALVLLRARTGALSEAGERLRTVLDRYADDWRHVKLEITGEDLKAAGHPAGPALGAALRETLDAKLDGKVRGRDEELAYALALLR
jgi:tRNA nucleotidyltransferase (CCA-adding enzyme)